MMLDMAPNTGLHVRAASYKSDQQIQGYSCDQQRHGSDTLSCKDLGTCLAKTWARLPCFFLVGVPILWYVRRVSGSTIFTHAHKHLIAGPAALFWIIVWMPLHLVCGELLMVLHVLCRLAQSFPSLVRHLLVVAFTGRDVCCPGRAFVCQHTNTHTLPRMHSYCIFLPHCIA
jgi:hypothetical protein